MAKRKIALIFSTILYLSCNNSNTITNALPAAAYKYATISYLDIKLDSNGHLPSNPYILAYRKGNKEIVFCGVEHLSDDSNINDPMFRAIENKFFEVKPSVAVNEGGDVSGKKYNSREEALLQDGEIGLIKILADSTKIPTVNGDPSIEKEFAELLKKYSIGEFLAYIVTERLMWGLYGAGITDTATIENRYNKFLEKYIMQQGKVALSENEQQFSFYIKNYKLLVGRPFSVKTLKPTNPFDPNGKFQEVGRSSKEIRDQFLLHTIDSLVNTNDKVFVVFGGWHLLTCEPGLKQIIDKQKE